MDAPSVFGPDTDGTCLAVFDFHFHTAAFGLLYGEGDGNLLERDFHGDIALFDFHGEIIRSLFRGFAAVSLDGLHVSLVAGVR